jgi:glutamate--cysteine ligase
MRGADGGPSRRICAVPAFWVGLLYDSAALDAAWEIVRDWSEEEREQLRQAVPQTALETPFRNRTVREIAEEVVELARSGLSRRGNLNGEGVDETIYLSSLAENLATGKTPADRMLEQYETEWNGDIDRVFTEYAY